jgi:hypothetical protein
LRNCGSCWFGVDKPGVPRDHRFCLNFQGNKHIFDPPENSVCWVDENKLHVKRDSLVN